jgi:hypothetical protein
METFVPQLKRGRVRIEAAPGAQGAKPLTKSQPEGGQAAPGGAPAARLELGAGCRGLCVLFAAVGEEANSKGQPADETRIESSGPC